MPSYPHTIKRKSQEAGCAIFFGLVGRVIGLCFRFGRVLVADETKVLTCVVSRVVGCAQGFF